MPLISEYSSSHNHLRLVLQGPSGTGKSCIAAQFPKPWIFDLDVKLRSALLYLKRNNLALPVGYDRVDINEYDKDETGQPKPIDKMQRFLHFDKLLIAANNNPLVETIVLDSATFLIDILINEVLRQQNKTKMADFKDGRQFWIFFGPFCRNFFSTLAQFHKHVVLIAHEKTNKNSEGAIVYPIKVDWPGKDGEKIGAFFDCVWRAEVDKIPNGPGQVKYNWKIRTKPEGMYELNDTLDMPSTFQFKWETIQVALDKGKL